MTRAKCARGSASDPSAVVDVMALMGDSIDNIKGVPGIGEKTATALIKHFGSLDKLYAHVPEVETIVGLRGAKRIAALLAEHRSSAELARKLVSIDTAAPVEADVSALDWPGIDERAVSELLRELEFHSLLNELTPAQATLPAGGAQRRELEVTAAEVPALIARLAHAPRLALYLEDLKTARLAPRLLRMNRTPKDRRRPTARANPPLH